MEGNPLQLNRIVSFHKALADPTRIRILAILAKGPQHGQYLAEHLGLTPPTITYHMARLRDAGLVKTRREKNTIYFYLEELTLQRDAQATVNVIFQSVKNTLSGEEWGSEILDTKQEKEREAVLRNFFTPDGILKQIPVQRKKKRFVLEKMLEGFVVGRKYSEKEINEHIKTFHPDYATIRREFIINHYMYRDNGIYEMNPPELWGNED
jgi:biotin operon repressor